MIETLQSYEVDYVLLPAQRPSRTLARFLGPPRPGGERYRFYAVDRDEIIVPRPGPLSGAYRKADEPSYAVLALQSGVDRLPENTGLRTELASLLMFQDAGAAVRVQREVVGRFSEVPAYRVKLGTVLTMSGDEAAADRQFETAISQNPLSPELRADMALANQIAGRDRMLLKYYERALKLEPDNPEYNLSVGNAYAGLASGDDRNEEYFQRAEEHRERPAGLAPGPAG